MNAAAATSYYTDPLASRPGAHKKLASRQCLKRRKHIARLKARKLIRGPRDPDSRDVQIRAWTKVRPFVSKGKRSRR